MASRKDELNKAKEAGKSIVEKQSKEKPAVPNKEEKPKKEQSLVAKQFGNPNSKTYDDVLRENGNDPAKMADWMNNNPEYKAGNKTKKGMEEFGYSQGADGKWVPKPKTETSTTSETKTTTETTTTDTTPSSKVTTDGAATSETETTTDDALNGVETITEEDPKTKSFVDSVTNKDGSVNEQKALDAMSQYEQKMVEMGAGSFEGNKFVFKDTTKKGWEDWATMLSVGASVIGLAMGVPIMPINFRKLTNKDEKDAKIREFQKQYADIMAGNAAKVEDVESSKEAGDYIKKNQDSIDAFTNYAENTASYRAKSDIDTDSEKELIDKKLEAEMTLVNEEFKNKIGEMKLSHEQEKDLQELMSNLSTESAKELLNQERYKYLIDMAKDMKEAGMDDRAISLKIQSLAGNTATKQNLKHAESIVGMITNLLESASGFMPWGGKKKK